MKNQSSDPSFEVDKSIKPNKGKSAARMNALRSGLFARSPVIKTAHYQESEEDFRKMHEDLRSTLAPQGPIEEELVRQLASYIHSRKRGEFFESATVTHYQEETLHQREEELGIPALRQKIEAAKERVRLRQDYLEELSRLPEDVVAAATSDFDKYRNGFAVIYNRLYADSELNVQMALSRAWKLGRFHVALADSSLCPYAPATLREVLLEKTTGELQKEMAELARLYARLKTNQRKLKRMMSQDSLRCLVPRDQDLEALDRFYSMHNRNIGKHFDFYANLQIARIKSSNQMGPKQLQGHNDNTRAGNSESDQHAHSVAAADQQSTTGGGNVPLAA